MKVLAIALVASALAACDQGSVDEREVRRARIGAELCAAHGGFERYGMSKIRNKWICRDGTRFYFSDYGG